MILVTFRLYLKVLHIFIFVFPLSFSYAQSDHYWSQNFNTESSLLAGAVVGGEAGSSAVYYNPALINHEESHKFALSANLLSFQSREFENLAGTNTKFGKMGLQIQPKFISYAGSPRNKSKLTYEFAFLVPLTTNMKFTYLYNKEIDIINRLDGDEDYTGEIVYRNFYDDYYVGGGVSYKLSDRFSIGASAFFSIKQLEYRFSLAMKAMQDSDTVYSQGNPEPFYFAQNTYSDRLHYWDMSLLLKLGFHYNSPNGNWGIGFTLTTPNLHISGKGDVKKDYFRSNVFDNSTGQFTKDLAFSNYQIDVSTKIKDPFSIAFGLLYKIPKSKNSIMFTTEYFVAIDPYAMLKTTDSKVVGNTQIENVSEAMTFYSSANAVLNVGVGYDQFINDHFTIKSGFRTDFNTLTGQEQIILNEPWYNSRLSRIYYDKFHLIVGPAIRVKKFGVVLGMQYTWGRKSELSNTLSFVDPVEFDPLTHLSLQGVRQNNMKISHNEISIFFGVTYGFVQE